MTDLAFRPLAPGDAGALHTLVSNWAVVRNLGTWPWPPDPAFTASRARPFDGPGFVWAVLVGGRLSGTVGVTRGELGYMLVPEVQGRGVATRACRMALDAAFADPGLAGVTARIWADNRASARVLTKLGFRETGRHRDHSPARGVEAAGIDLALTRGEWLEGGGTIR
jgi:RimJ/RimL family protein N-acetyltransferase